MRVIVFSEVAGMGGSEVLMSEAVRAAMQAGAELEVLAVPGGGLDRLLSQAPDLSKVARLPWPFAIQPAAAPAGDSPEPAPSPPGNPGRSRAYSPLRLLGFWRSARRWRSVLRARRADLLFINLNGSESIALGARMAGVKRVVGCYHLSVAIREEGLPARLIDWLLQMISMWSCHEVVHTSEGARRQWCRRTGFPPGRTTLIVNGVEPQQTTREAARERLSWPDSRLVFCIPARLDRNKGHAEAVEAFARTSHTLGPSRLALCGDGPERAALERLAERRGVADRVEFLGWRRDLPLILAAADCVILPSLHSENLSLAVLEAMMAGVPAIVTDVGGMSEAVEAGVTGWVVPPGRPDLMAAAIAEAAADPAERRRRGARSRERALARFARERMLSEYRRLFTGTGAIPA